ncbi:MAG: hypothetical protein Q9209_000788 [Squamulea sp. 1 TL-2023]
MPRLDFSLLVILALSLFSSLVIAAPKLDNDLPLALCHNPPYTNIIAGTLTPAFYSSARKRSPPPSLSTPTSTPSLLLCAPNSRTYIDLHPTIPIPSNILRPIITSALQRISNPPKDGPISLHSGWIFNVTVGAYSLRIMNAGVEEIPLWIYAFSGVIRRHVSYGEVRDALVVLEMWMEEKGWRGGGFEIWHAGREVGRGWLGRD